MGTKSSKQRKNRQKKSNLSPLSISQNNLHLTDCSYDSNSLIGANSDNKAYSNSFSDSPLPKVKTINHNKITNLLLSSSFQPNLQLHKKKIKKSKINRILSKNHNSVLLFSMSALNLMTDKLNKENNLHLYLSNSIHNDIGRLDYNISKSKFYFRKDKSKMTESLVNQYLDMEREENEDRYQNYLINDLISTRKEDSSFNFNTNSTVFNDKDLDEKKDEIKEFPIIKVKSVLINNSKKKPQRKKITNKTNNKTVNNMIYPSNINVNNINIKINELKVYNNGVSSKNKFDKQTIKCHLKQKELKRSETPVFKRKKDKYIDNLQTNKKNKQKRDISQDTIDSFDQFSFGCHDS